MELAVGEGVLVTESFIESLGRFLERTTVTLTPGRIVYKRRRMLLGLIPLGTRTDTYPLANISAVGTATSISPLKVLLGILLVAAGVGLPSLPLQDSGSGTIVVALVFLIVSGMVVILDAFRARFYVSTSGGQHYDLPIALTSKARGETLAEAVNKAIVQLHERVGPKIGV